MRKYSPKTKTKALVLFGIGLLICVLVLVSTCVRAEDTTLSWTNPTDTFEMTSAGPYTNPAGTKIYQLVAVVNDPTAESVVLPALPPGEYTYVAVSYDADGVSSPVSGEATKTVTSFVAVAGTVYYPIPQPNDVLMLPIGTVPVGTPCNPDLQVKGLFAVDTAAVIWAGTARPLMVVAECG
jgi:hypothetical protein